MPIKHDENENALNLCIEVEKRFLFWRNFSLHVEREGIDCETDSKEIPARALGKKAYFCDY